MQITHDLNIGGLQRVASDIALNIDQTKFEVSVCALREGGPFEDEMLEAGIRVIRLPATHNGVDYLSFWKLFKLLKKEKPHLIHTHNTQPLLDGIMAAILAGVPVRIHTDHAREFPDKRRYMYAEWFMSHFTDRMVAVSDSTKADLVKYEKIKPKKIEVIQNGIDGKKHLVKIDIKEKKKELGIENTFTPILGFVGRLSNEKGLIYLIKAIKLLVKDFPEVILLIAGEGELLNALKREIVELGIERNVTFLGPRNDIWEVMQLFDIFVLPSEREGLSLVLLEATAAALPIVATDVGGNRIVVKDGENGFVVRPKDTYSLYNAIKQLISNEGFQRRFAEYSFDLFKNNFSIEKMVKKYETLYLSSCAGRGIRLRNSVQFESIRN
ncbi:MAG: glycosyltransferase family 4 protein [Candidatus Brocadiaceae bacterium]|nr:glycosyltransferase family 4 protein [Candidatus Brocadiaceae bacterium]